MNKIVIIGGGIAGTTAAEEIRKQNNNVEIIIIDRENQTCYSRVLLMPYVNGQVAKEKLILKKPEWYQEKNIELMSGVEVQKIDIKNNFVQISGGRELPYDKLLLTTGLDVRYTPEDKYGVVYFKTINDADLMKSLIKEAKIKKNNNALIYGGGFIAMDYLSIFENYKFDITVLMRSNGFWSKIISKHSQKVLEKHAIENGIKFVYGVKDLELLGEKELVGVNTNGVKYSGSILAVGIGLDVEKSILDEAGLEISNGIICNGFLETNVPNIFTAGDVAEYYDDIIERKIRYGNWTNAIMQARAVAKTILGQKTKFAIVSSYATSLFGKQIAFIGDVNRSAADKIIQKEADDKNSTELFIRNNKIVGAIMIGDVSERTNIVTAIKNKENYNL